MLLMVLLVLLPNNEEKMVKLHSLAVRFRPVKTVPHFIKRVQRNDRTHFQL